MSFSDEDIVKAIKSYQERLDRYVSHNNKEKILYVLSRLRKLPIKTIHLEKTGVGRTVNALKKIGDDVGENAKELVAHWKMMVVEEEQAAQEAANCDDNIDSAVESAPDSSFSDNERNNSEYAEERNNSNKCEQSEVEEEEEEENINSSHSLSDSNKYDSDNDSTNNYIREKKNESSHRSKSENHRESEDKKHRYEKDKRSDRHSSKRKRDSSSGSEEEEEKSKHSRSSSSRDKSHSKRKRDSSESSDDEDDDYEKYDRKKSKHRRESSSSDSYHKKHKSRSEREEKSSSKSKSKEKSSSDKKLKEDRSESKHKSESKPNKHDREEKSNKYDKSEHKKDRHSEKESKSKHESSKSSKSDKDSSKSKSHSERHDKDKKDKEKSKRDDSDVKHYSSRDKDKGEKDKEKESREKDKEKSYHSKSKSEKEKSSSSSKHNSSSSHSSSKTDKQEKKDKEKKDKTPTPKNKERIINGIDSESGASFAEALGMCEPVRTKKKKPVPSTSFAPEKSERPPEKYSSRPSSSKVDEDEMSDEKYVPELLREPKLEPINLNLSSLLPEITPNYRPVGIPLDNQPKRLISEDEALSRVMTNKNLRTKVYSGNKTVGKVESLFELCVRVLQDNIDALEYTGGVPYLILKPVLEKATPDQLFNMEHHNPYLIDDTDDLWKLHCQKEFRNKKREELESWRDMYMRCLDEREARLNAITANIKQSQKVAIPVRTAKLAYVDSVAKPPRNIARKQAKNGIVNDQKQSTTAKLSALATAGEAGKVAVPNPGSKASERSSSSSSSSCMKPKKAPLMAKTLSFLKNRFKR